MAIPRTETTSSRGERSVAILFDPEGSWSLAAIEGIAEYAKRHGGWRLLCAPRDSNGKLQLPPGWRGDGIISRFLSHQSRRQHLAYKIPIVDLETLTPGTYNPLIANVVTDDEARADLIVEHLLSLERDKLACFNPPHPQYSQHRVAKVQAKLQQAGHECDLFWKFQDKVWFKHDWESQQNLIRKWLLKLPANTGLFTADGRQGRLVTEWCHFLNLRVPEDLAVLTGDDDALLSAISSPPLSGIVLAAKQHGFEAAALLDQMLDGAAAPRQPIRIQPLHVAVRQSTDILKYDRPEVVQAIRFIRENASRGINVSDVLNQIPISRRSLEQLFLQTIGHTLGHEIRRVRFEKAKTQLANTDMTLERIAASCGYSSASQLCRRFQKMLGETPLSYRKRNS
ncbi:Xylose operon regulatory protein [Roseimaritima multifibrata]|uniref:Xylose operon regulatory protein n=1 Tax=Roseimaritima multifibrata TaxID=1930274 RepID=A0A517MC12_9BACT|nr:DNA-binding transcriptional regulator [Roseimaritima multifibrata]QDS92429.1 Xylose operon regulatory protein [Roseimaritima multifibrata]